MRWSRPISRRREAGNIVPAPGSMVMLAPVPEIASCRSSLSLRPPAGCRRDGGGVVPLAIAQQPPSPTRVRGTIEGVDGDMLAVKSRSGEDVRLRMTADIRVVGIVKIALSDIKVGSFIGTTTVPGPDGVQNAIEVHVFPENDARHRRGLAALRSASQQQHDQRHRRRDPSSAMTATRCCQIQGRREEGAGRRRRRLS